jgi:hypothetical protein
LRIRKSPLSDSMLKVGPPLPRRAIAIGPEMRRAPALVGRQRDRHFLNPFPEDGRFDHHLGSELHAGR